MSVSTGIGNEWTRETEPEQSAQLLGRAHGVIAVAADYETVIRDVAACLRSAKASVA
jgi:hypothetical protein